MEGVAAENKGRISIISIYSGIVMIQNCQLTLAYLTTLTNIIVPAIYLENANVFIESVWIKGNSEFMTIGILSFLSNIKLINCKLLNHRCGGVLAKVNETNNITINKSWLNENTGCGILIVGNAEIKLEDNLIEKNQGIGIKILDCKKINMTGNKINENLLNGLQLLNCDGLIILNSFFKNKGHGAVLESLNGEFDARIMKNIFVENYLNGILVTGERNNAKISKNEKIAFNYLSGILITQNASPNIIENKISENLHQGILITTGAYANIEQNEIFANIRSNIAFGGDLSDKTSIINNKVFGSRNEGIFIIEGKGGQIIENEIFENNDGIIIVHSDDCEIRKNNIYGNIRCGVLVSDLSNPNLIENSIHDNQFLGIFIRDKSKGDYRKNEIRQNISQFYLSRDCRNLKEQLNMSNDIEGRFDIAPRCSIF